MVDAKYMKAKEAAEYLGYAVNTLANMRHEGYGPAWIVIGTRSIRYDKQALDEWMDGKDQGGKE